MALNLSEGTASQTSLSMLQSAQDNDPAAWQRIVNTYSRRIYRWCRQARLQPEDASDITQEVFRAVARKLVDFHRNNPSDSFRGWLYRITQNKLRDHFRRRSSHPETALGGTDAQRRFMALAEPTSGSDSDNRVAASDALHATVIARLQAECSQRDWLVFWRVVVDGQTSTEAGAQFDMSSNAVRLVKMRILRRLRLLMGATTEDNANP